MCHALLVFGVYGSILVGSHLSCQWFFHTSQTDLLNMQQPVIYAYVNICVQRDGESAQHTAVVILAVYHM